MGIFSKNKNKEKDELTLVLDVRSSSVGGALFEIQKSGIPEIVLSLREPIMLEHKVDFDSLLLSTTKALEIVAGKICLAGLGAPERIICVLSSPWYVSQTRVINFNKNTPFTFTAKLADGLIQKEINFFKEEHMAKYSNTPNHAHLIEIKNIKTTLNGYETSEPLSKKAKEIEMTVFISMSSKVVLEKMEKSIMRHFHSEDIEFSSFAMASFTVVRDMYAHQDNFLLLDIGGEVTDIFLVKKNVLRESISFPSGTNFIVRGVASALNCALSEAKSLISLLKDGHAVKTVAKNLEPVMNKLKTQWLKHLEASLSGLSSDISIPSTIYLIVDKDLADFFSEIIKTEQLNQYTLTESKFKVVFLDIRIFHGMTVFKEDTVRDTFLVIDSIYINRFLN